MSVPFHRGKRRGMFTGIVEEVGKLVSIRQGGESARLTVAAPLVCQDARLGDSIAINGTCLTIVEIQGDRLSFDAVPETIRRTSLGGLKPGAAVNLERALAVGQRLGGHFVQGHVDGIGTLLSVREEENARILKVGAPADLMRYLLPKGSVAVDGISLTVADVGPDWFTLWIIPHTWANTSLREKRVGDAVNLEADMLAKYIERLLAARETPPPGVTLEALASGGFTG
jgi:riboflavin synthase